LIERIGHEITAGALAFEERWRRKELVVLALWQLPPWIVLGLLFAYDVNFWLAVLAYGGTRLVCRLIQANVLRGLA